MYAYGGAYRVNINSVEISYENWVISREEKLSRFIVDVCVCLDQQASNFGYISTNLE